ncbi:MAG: aryl-sulfate sulfotransferase [Candidatus Hodarchaeales archaeon]
MNSINGIPPTLSQVITDSLEITAINADKALNGKNIFAIWMKDADSIPWNGSAIIIMDMEGNIVNSYYDSNEGTDANKRIRSGIKLINSTTILFWIRNSADPSGSDNRAYFWNLETNETERFEFLANGIHEIEYNPFTDSFLMKNHLTRGTYNGLPILYDDLYEYDRVGNVKWYWNGTEHFPFNEAIYLINNETHHGETSWMHGNTVFWDMEEDVIYINPREMDTFYKIDKTTGDVLWGLGRLGNFTLYDQNGVERETLFYHAHGVEKIGPDRFIIFDNDMMNTTRTNPEDGINRYIELVVDENNMVANITWTWDAPKSHFQGPYGDADRLPNGNTLGTFGFSNHPLYLTEVTKEGQIAWEAKFDFSSDQVWQILQSDRYFDQPIIDLEKDEFTVEIGSPLDVNLSTWNNFRTRYHYNGTAKVMNGDTVVFEKDFQFLPYWQETKLTLTLTNLPAGLNNLEVVIENADGITASTTITINDRNNIVGSLDLFFTCVLVMASAALFRKKKKKERNR